ncbi:MAG: response regulator transcription factor [Anaerolineae bacterium]
MAKLLLIDDDPTILEMFKLALSKAGFEVITAKDGDEGLAAFAEQKPDVCVVDIAMPGIDGYEVAERIRDSDRSNIPVIFLPAHDQSVMRAHADEVGVDLYLKKPIRPADLVTHIKKLVKP